MKEAPVVPSIERFVAALEKAGGQAVLVHPERVAETVAGLVSADGLVLVEESLAGLAEGLRMRDVEVEVIPGRQTVAEGREADLSAAGAAITSGDFAIVDTGSVGLLLREDYRGLLATLPAHHVVVLGASVLLPSLADALRVSRTRLSQPGSRLMLITGPSRTADIELTPVVGVHGPLRYDVVLVHDASWSTAARPPEGVTPEGSE